MTNSPMRQRSRELSHERSLRNLHATRPLLNAIGNGKPESTVYTRRSRRTDLADIVGHTTKRDKLPLGQTGNRRGPLQCLRAFDTRLVLRGQVALLAGVHLRLCQAIKPLVWVADQLGACLRCLRSAAVQRKSSRRRRKDAGQPDFCDLYRRFHAA